MKPMKRIFTTITSQFDQLVYQIENHEAVAEASLKQLKSDIQKARVQKRFLQKEIEKRDQQEALSCEAKAQWQERAVRFAKEDRDKALHCMKKISDTENEILRHQSARSDLNTALNGLDKQLTQVDGHYQQLLVKIQTYQARDRAAQIKGTSLCEAFTEDAMDDVFSRWDHKITTKEVSADDLPGSGDDEITEAIISAEEESRLESALDALVKTSEEE